MGRIFVTSDSHYGHANIAGPNTSKWKTGYRNFASVDEMNAALVKHINQRVKEDDTLYHLGDWSFGGIDNIWRFRKQLICRNIHLVLGNHDHHIEANKQIKISADDYNLIEALGIPEDVYKRFGGYSHIDARDLFTSVNHVVQFKAGKHTFFCSHYAHRVWEGSHKGVCHLYAHSHGSILDYGKSIDVGVDVAFKVTGRYRPFAIEEIIEILDKYEIEFPDHHDKNTNIR